MKNRFFRNSIVALGVIAYLASVSIGHAATSLLTPEETLWLKNRNNTIVVYPEKNFPPFSYQNTAGIPQGLSVDYLELIAQKVGAKLVYLPARPLSQILDDAKSGKGDVLTSLADTPERQEHFLFSDSYISVPAVLVVRKDAQISSGTLSDFNGKRVALGASYAVEAFVQQNYPRVIIESVTDDEIGLQQVVLGDVDAAVMDVATLSFYLSRQAFSSVKIIGNTGFEYKLAFAVQKNKPFLQSILDKGLSQISVGERQVLSEKWVSIHTSIANDSFIAKAQQTIGAPLLYMLIFLGFGAILFALGRRYGVPYYHRRSRRLRTLDALEDKIEELHESEAVLSEEMDEIKKLEKSIASKIEGLNKE